MANRLPPGYVLPNPKLPKVVGLLNLVFGSILLLIGLGTVAWVLFLTRIEASLTMVPTANPGQDPTQAWRDGIEQLKEMEADAKTPEDRERYRAERLAQEATPPKKKPEARSMTLNNVPRGRLEWAVFWVEWPAVIVLNMAMIVSGFGLIVLKGWARRLALWVFGSKIALSLVLTAVSIVWLIPRQAREFAPDVAEGAGVPVRRNVLENPAVRVWVITMSTLTVFGFAVIVTYPIVGLVMLTRPGARAACLASGGTRRPGKPPAVSLQ